jgi:hypothetical protein
MLEFLLLLVVSQMVAVAAEELERKGKKVGTTLKLLFCEVFLCQESLCFRDCTYSVNAMESLFV